MFNQCILSRKMKSKNFHAHRHVIHQKNCMVSTIPGMCDFKSVHEGKKTYFIFNDFQCKNVA